MAIERLSGSDQMMQRLGKLWPQDNGALFLLDGASLFDPSGPFRIEKVTEKVRARLPLVPRFRQVIRPAPRGLGDPLWVDATAFELSNHLHVQSLPPGADEAELLRVVEALSRERLKSDQPLWQLWFLTGLADQKVALFAKVNHAIADGMAMIGALTTFLDAEPGLDEATLDGWIPTPEPSRADLLADNLRRKLEGALASPRTLARTLSALPAARELFAETPASPSSLDKLAGERRRLALIRSSLQPFKDAAHAHAATVNDALLAVIASGLRALLKHRKELTPGFIVRAYVPVSLRPARDAAVQGNEVAEMVVPLPVDFRDEATLLQDIAAETRRRKARPRAPITGPLRSKLVAQLMMKSLKRQHVNVTTANLHGPAQLLYFCGAKVLEVFPVVPLIGKAALGVGAVSYAGEFSIAVVADEDAYPDLDTFVNGAKQALAPVLSARPVSLQRARGPRLSKRALRTPALPGASSIAEAAFLELGGVKQWVLIRGEDTANPPLILLHGGPGMSDAGFFRYYNAPLEKHFTCVNWDQRGAGKSFDDSIPTASMKVEQFLSDLDELVEHVRRRVKQDKVVLLGHSWGSALGVLYAARFPEKVSAYVGSGQLGDAAKAEAASYAYAVAEAEHQGNKKALAALREIGAPPYSSDALWVERNWVARLEGGTSPRAMWRMLKMTLGVPESSLLDVPRVMRALRWSLDATFAETSRLNLLEAAPELKVPVFFFLGRKDHWVPPQTSVEYFQKLQAPSKELLWFESSGHEPFADEPEKFNAAMIERVLPVARRNAVVSEVRPEELRL